MSGSDPSVSRTGSGGSTADECPGAPFETVLASPDPAAVASLAPGDLLDVVAVDSPTRGVHAQTVQGTYVAALTRDIPRLRRCIAGGNLYEADVVRVAGGSVTVVVRPA